MICYISIVNARDSEGNIEIEKVVLACKILNKQKKLICTIILLQSECKKSKVEFFNCQQINNSV